MGTGTARSRSQTSPAAFPPVRTLVQSRHSPEPSRLPRFPSALSFPGVQGGVRWGGWPRKTGGEGKRRAPRALPRSCWRRDSSGAPMPARPSYSQRAPLAQLAGRPGRTPSASSRPALPGSVGQSPARRLRGTGLEGGPPPRADPCAHPPGRPESPGTGDGGGSRKSSRSRPRLGAAVMPGSASRGQSGGEGLLGAGGELGQRALHGSRGARTPRPARPARRPRARGASRPAACARSQDGGLLWCAQNPAPSAQARGTGSCGVCP